MKPPLPFSLPPFRSEVRPENCPDASGKERCRWRSLPPQGQGWLCRVRKRSVDWLPGLGPGVTVLNKLFWPACKIPGNSLFQQSVVNWESTKCSAQEMELRDKQARPEAEIWKEEKDIAGEKVQREEVLDDSEMRLRTPLVWKGELTQNTGNLFKASTKTPSFQLSFPSDSSSTQ